MSANASLTIVGGPQRIEPGRETTLTAQVMNLGPQADDFRLSVRDIDPAWVTFRPPTVYLRPSEQATTSITITPPLGVAPQELSPIFRLLSRRAGNVAIVEIAMPTPRLSTPPPYTPATPEPERTTQAAPWPPERRRRGGGAVPLVLGIGAGLVLIIALVGVSGLILSRRDAATQPTVTVAGASVPVAASAPASGATATVPAPIAPAATAPFVGKTYLVADTGGDGVYLRRTTNLEDRDTAYADDTRLAQIGPDVQAGGVTWRRVRTPDGKTGYVPAQYTKETP